MRAKSSALTQPGVLGRSCCSPGCPSLTRACLPIRLVDDFANEHRDWVPERRAILDGRAEHWPLERRAATWHSACEVGNPMASSNLTVLGAPSVLECSGLTKVYQMGEVQVRALDGVDFTLGRGELVVLLGASGSGKSTLLNILGGLDTPSSGSVSFGAWSLTDASEDELTEYRRRHVGFVFQFYNLIPSLTARENVELVTEIADDPLEPADVLGLVGLGDRLDHFPGQLSGGEQQRVAIARAVAKRPSLLLCDEPTGALDFRTGIVVLDVIERVNREIGTATVLITHNAPIARMAQRVVTLSDGRVQSDVTPAERMSARALSW